MGQFFNIYLLHIIRGGPTKELKEKGVMGRTQTSETSISTRVRFDSVVAVHRGVL